MGLAACWTDTFTLVGKPSKMNTSVYIVKILEPIAIISNRSAIETALLCLFVRRMSVTATADVSGCSVWVCGICDAKASSYLGSGRMTEVIRLVLYTEVLGPWDSDCAGGRLLSTDTGLADLLPLGVLNTSSLSTISSYGSISIYLSSIVMNKDKTWYISFYLLLATQWQHSTINSIGGFQVYSG